MRVAPVADVKAKLSAYLDECKTSGPLVITRNGRAVAILIAPEDEEHLEMMVIASSPKFQAMMERGRKAFREGKTIPHDEFWKMVKRRTAARAKNGQKSKR